MEGQGKKAERADKKAVIRPYREESTLSVGYVPQIRRLANRVYVQAFIDERGYTVQAIDEYADWLVNQYALSGPREREVLRVAITAFIDGWLAGYDGGYDDGV